MKLKLVGVVLLLAIGVAAVALATGIVPTTRASQTSFLTAAVTRTNVANDIAATGTIEPTARYALAFGQPAQQFSGDTVPTGSGTGTASWPVKTVAVAVGDPVKKNQVVATADTTTLHNDRLNALDSWRVARIQLKTANTALSDAIDAGRTGDELDQLRSSVFNARTRVRDAEKAVSDANTKLSAATLRSPVDGVVTEVDISKGVDAPNGAALVIDGNAFQVTADVVEGDLANVKNGQPATVTVAAIGDSIGGSVARISPTPTASTSTSNNVVSYPVTVTLQNPPAAVRSGMSADISITIAAAQSVLAVPTTALVGSDGQYAVRVPTETGTPEVKPVTVGLVTNAMAEIRSGLSEGDLVITGTASQSQTTAAPGGFGGGVGIPFGGGGFQRNGGNGARGGNGGNGARGGNGG